MGIEPTTSTLARWRSTAELRPLIASERLCFGARAAYAPHDQKAQVPLAVLDAAKGVGLNYNDDNIRDPF